METCATTVMSDKFDAEVFNRLTTPEDADAAVRSSGHFKRHMDQMNDLFRAHGIESSFGICLLHNHFQLEADEILLEREEMVDGEAALITRPVHDTSGPARAVPVSWALHDGVMHPLNFSTDPTAIECYRPSLLTEKFLDDFAQATRNSPIGEWLGLAVCRRSLFDRAEGNESAVEFTIEPDRSNAIFLRDRVEGRIIETSWTFDESASLTCQTKCDIDNIGRHYNHHDLSGCKSTCRVDPGTGGHYAHHHNT